MIETNTSAIDAANEALSDPAPRISNAPVTEVLLMRGVLRDSQWLQESVIRELNGEDEEAIASLTSKNELVYSDYMTALLKRAVVSIGNVQMSDDPTMVDDLLIGDRDLLFIGAMKATYGRFREMEVLLSNFVTQQVQIVRMLQKMQKLTQNKTPLCWHVVLNGAMTNQPMSKNGLRHWVSAIETSWYGH